MCALCTLFSLWLQAQTVPDRQVVPDEEVVTKTGTEPVDELRKAILMVYYGTSDDSVRTVSIDAMTEKVRRAFPEYEVRDAFTSKGAIRALKRRTGIEKPIPWDALLQLRKDGYNSVIVGNGDLIAGDDTQILAQEIRELYPRFFEIKLTTPLLYTAEDCHRVMEILVGKVHAQADEQVVFVGHGKDGAANDVYCLVDYILQNEGHPLKQIGTRKVVLVPLIMIAAGHATKDIFKTWREELEAEGYTVRIVRTAVQEYPEIQQQIIEKIKKVDEEP